MFKCSELGCSGLRMFKCFELGCLSRVRMFKCEDVLDLVKLIN
jgi:hypothetical protein